MLRTPTPSLTARMKSQAVKYVQRTNADLSDAAKMARLGLLTMDGRLKFKGAGAPKKGEKRETIDVTDEEMTTFRRRVREARNVGLAKDQFGYYVTDGTRRSSSYPTVSQIPVAVVRDYAS